MGGCLQCVFGVCEFCMKGKKGACKTSNHPFNFLFIFVCVSVYVLTGPGNGRCHDEGPGVCNGRGSDQGPVHPWTTSYALNNPLLLELY